MTWSKNKDPKLFWPSKFLSDEVKINEARILTYGFNTSAATLSVSGLARIMLNELKHAMNDKTGESLKIGAVSQLAGHQKPEP
jgi:hypothetical protein